MGRSMNIFCMLFLPPLAFQDLSSLNQTPKSIGIKVRKRANVLAILNGKTCSSVCCNASDVVVLKNREVHCIEQISLALNVKK